MEYEFPPDTRGEGYELFANMNADDDAKDAGKNTCLGRWHDLASGTGLLVCSSPSEWDVQSWANNWTGKGMCTCHVRPVVTDAQLRKAILASPISEEPVRPTRSRSWFW